MYKDTVEFCRVKPEIAEEYMRSIFCLDRVECGIMFDPTLYAFVVRVCIKESRQKWKWFSFQIDYLETWGNFTAKCERLLYSVHLELEPKETDDNTREKAVGGKTRYTAEELRCLLS